MIKSNKGLTEHLKQPFCLIRCKIKMFLSPSTLRQASCRKWDITIWLEVWSRNTDVHLFPFSNPWNYKNPHKQIREFKTLKEITLLPVWSKHIKHWLFGFMTEKFLHSWWLLTVPQSGTSIKLTCLKEPTQGTAELTLTSYVKPD